MRRGMSLAALALLAAVLLSGCGWKGSGAVEDRSHRPGYYQTTFICGSYGKNGLCTVQVPMQSWVPDSWSVEVKDDSGKDHWVGVTEDYYSRVKDGDYFSNEDSK